MAECMPCIIKQLGEKVGMTPISWAEHADRVIVVFEQGPKLTFYREVEAEPVAPKTKKPRKAKTK